MSEIKTITEYQERKRDYESAVKKSKKNTPFNNLVVPTVWGLAGTTAGAGIGGALSMLLSSKISDKSYFGIAIGSMLLGGVGATIAGITAARKNNKNTEQNLEKELNYLKQYEQTHKNEFEVEA